jgi:hypothetical protein
VLVALARSEEMTMRWDRTTNYEGFSEKFARASPNGAYPPAGKYLLREIRAYAKKHGVIVDAYYRTSQKFIFAYRVGPDGKAKTRATVHS